MQIPCAPALEDSRTSRIVLPAYGCCQIRR